MIVLQIGLNFISSVYLTFIIDDNISITTSKREHSHLDLKCLLNQSEFNRK